MLEVRLIGTFEIHSDGRTINLPSRPAQSLLAFLLLNPGTPHRREKLAGMFWPDSTEGRARASLRHELWRIRKALAVGGAQAALLTDDITVAVCPGDDVRVDLYAWQNLREDAGIDQLASLLVSYREVLPGFYEDWITPEREQIRCSYEKHVGRLLELLEREQRWNEMVDWAERWLAVDPAAEAAYRALMVAYAGTGNQTKANAAFERCQLALHEIGGEPSAELQHMLKPQPRNHNLPSPMTALIGREHERREVAARLLESRLVTLTGSGGVGKTRLAIQVGRDALPRFKDGAWFLTLAAAQNSDQVAEGLRSLFHVRGGSPEHPSDDLLRENLEFRSTLLILDNCEHLAGACIALVEPLLDCCPDLHVLVTSREPLGAQGEITYRVPSLAFPPATTDLEPSALAGCASVRLFIERARAREASFSLTPRNAASVASICRNLDGIPLAIELAAGRLSTIPVDSIAEHLNERFEVLAGGSRSALPRHQTLRAMIDWSYDSLSEPEKILFRRLGIFTGGFTLEAAQQVTAGQGLEGPSVLGLLPRLVDKSVVEFQGSGNRYSLLETVRMYALERLRAAGEEPALRMRHYEYFLAMAENCEVAGARHGEAAIPLAHEHENVLAALRWCERVEGGARMGLQLVGAARFNWMILGRPEEGFQLAQHFLDMPGCETRDSFRRRALYLRAHMGGFMSRYAAVQIAAQEALSIAREIDDRRGVAQCLYSLSDAYGQDGNETAAAECAREGLPLARELGLNRLVPGFLTVLGDIHRLHGEFSAARPLYREAVSIAREASAQDLSLYLLESAILEAELNVLPAARRFMVEAFETSEQNPYRSGFDSAPYGACAGILGASGDLVHAVMAFGAAEKQKERDAFCLSTADRAFLDSVADRARALLGEARFSAAWAEGRVLPAEQVWATIRGWLEENTSGDSAPVREEA